MVGQRERLEAVYRRRWPKGIDLVIPKVDILIKILSRFNFVLPEISYDGMRPSWHHLAFERSLSDKRIALIDVILASDGELSFGCAFSVRKCVDPYDWCLNAHLAKRRLGIWQTCDLGALNFWLFNEDVFEKDWNFLLSNVEDIIRFLETGEPNKNMAHVEIFQPNETRMP